MASDGSTLSVLASSLDDITQRLASMAERHAGSDNEQLAADLFEVERSLRTASRRLERVLRRMQ